MAYAKKVKATIQLDKLIFSCEPSIENNFVNSIIYEYNDIERTEIVFNETTLIRSENYKSAYKYCYKVLYLGFKFAQLEFCYKGELSEYIKFTVNNDVFYNGTIQLLPNILTDLNLLIKGFSQIDIAVDNYTQDCTKKLHSYIRNEKYELLVNCKYIKDMNVLINEIMYFSKGSRKKQNQIKSIKSSSKKEDKVYTTYNKMEEIQTESHKNYILDYHQKYNPNFKNIYREEVRLNYETIYRWQKKNNKKIELTDLFDKHFLYNLFLEFANRLIVAVNNKGNKIRLSPKPTFDYCEGILQHTPKMTLTSSYKTNNNDINNKNLIDKIKEFEESINNDSIITNNIICENNIVINKKVRKHSEETKKKISESMKGRRNPNYGKNLTTTHKEKIKESMIEYWSKKNN